VIDKFFECIEKISDAWVAITMRVGSPILNVKR
jgi:hypothetical protein